MNIFSTIFNALKDGATQMGEAPVDANDIATFEHELQNAQVALGKAKEGQILVKAQQQQANVKLSALNTQISTRKEAALNAMEHNNEELALTIAGDIVQLEQAKAGEVELVAYYQKSIDKLTIKIDKVQAEIREMQHHLSQVKATESVHRAQASIHASHLAKAGSVMSAKDSLQRIQAQQAQVQAHIDVADEVEDALSDTNNNNKLDAKLAAHETPKHESAAQEVLNRIKTNK